MSTAASASSLRPARSLPTRMAHRSSPIRCAVSSRESGRPARCQRHECEPCRTQLAEIGNEAARTGVRDREGRAHCHPQRPSRQGIGTRVVEHEPVPSEGGGIAHDRADVARVVDTLEKHQPVCRSAELGDGGTCRPFEQRHDRQRHAEAGDVPAQFLLRRRRYLLPTTLRSVGCGRDRRVRRPDGTRPPTPVRRRDLPRRGTGRRRNRRACRRGWRAPAR